MASTPKDLTGNKYGRLVAVKRLEMSPNAGYFWECSCECGGTTKVTIGNLNSGHTLSCGCLQKDNAYRTHGLSKTTEYKSWLKIKERIFDPNCKSYAEYGAKGITLQESWLDFNNFIAYIGMKPKDGKHYTVDRIDNDLGYQEGNVRWATNHQQARNKGFQQNNTSGVSGVLWDLKTNGKYSNTYAKAVWFNLKGKQENKLFSTKRYGLLPAFALACAYRKKMIEQLNAQGAGYSDKHGL